MNTRILTIGAAEMAAKLKRAEETTPGTQMAAVSRALFDLDAYVVNRKLSGQVLKRGSGQLARLTQRVFREKAKSITGVLSTNPTAFYGKVHEEGRPAIIVPKQSPVLRFFWLGQWWFLKKVKVRRRPFMEPSAREQMAHVTEILNEAFLKLVR